MNLSYSVQCQPKPGEGGFSGDAARVVEDRENNTILLVVVDVLGHGKEAHIVAAKALDFCEQSARSPLPEIIHGLHQHMRKSVGLVLTLCRIDKEERLLRYISIGDVRMLLVKRQESKECLRQAGVVGYQIPILQERSCSLVDVDMLLICSDGVGDFRKNQCDNLARRGPQSLGRFVISNFAKDTDDALCLTLAVLP